MEKFLPLDSGIEKIRRSAGYKLGDSFKFDTNLRPTHVTPEAATEAKRHVVELCLELGCRFIALAILHQIIKKDEPDAKYLWAANHVIGRFNHFLATEANDFGFVLVDTLPVKSQWQYLTEKFTVGLPQHTGRNAPLERIRLYGSTCLNASFISSAIDIVLGSFRYCVNDPKNRETATDMIRNVANMMWHQRKEDTIYLRERGLILRPETVKVPAYQKEYENLQANLKKLITGSTPAQTG